MSPDKNILFVAGARPNFMKVAPIIRELGTRGSAGVRARLVHTGQHYDPNMSKVFFSDLGIPEPDQNLGVGSGSHAVQTARIMVQFEKVLEAQRPDIVVVVGDVNSTIACALTAKKLAIRVAHVEAGLRSFDESMPEEINRRLTDAISDLLLVTERAGVENLAREGVPPDRVHLVGNVMIDTLMDTVRRIDDGSVAPTAAARDLRGRFERFAVLTLHRPSNVDVSETFAGIWRAIGSLSERIPVIFPVHPRTRERVGFIGLPSGVVLVDPVGYVDMVHLTRGAALVLTDSGGLQEETTALGVPCVTIRENTERPCTVEVGTNYLVGTDPRRILSTAEGILRGEAKKGTLPPLWDGQAAGRIALILIERLA